MWNLKPLPRVLHVVKFRYAETTRCKLRYCFLLLCACNVLFGQNTAEVEQINQRAAIILQEQGPAAAQKYLSDNFDSIADEKILYRLAFSHYLQGEYKVAELYARHLLSSGNKKLVGACFNLLGNLYARDSGSAYHDRFREYFQSSQELFLEIGEYKALFISYVEHSQMEYSNDKKYAQELLARALNLSVEIGDLPLFRYHQTAGIQSLHSNDFRQALYHFKEERSLQDKKNVYFQADIAYRLGQTYLGLGEPSHATKELRKAMEAFQDDTRGKVCQGLILVAKVCSDSLDLVTMKKMQSQILLELPSHLHADYDIIMKKYSRLCKKESLE